MSDHQGYLGRVWQTAFPRAWATAGSALTVLSVVLAYLIDRQPESSRMWNWLAWWAPLATVGLLLGWRILSAPFEIHQAQEQEIERLRWKLSNHVDHWELARALTSKHRHANHEFLNRLPETESEVIEWRARVNAWYDDVQELMLKHGCDEQERNHVDTINQLEMNHYALLPAYRGFPIDVAMLRIRLDRIAEVAHDHRDEAKRLVSLP